MFIRQRVDSMDRQRSVYHSKSREMTKVIEQLLYMQSYVYSIKVGSNLKKTSPNIDALQNHQWNSGLY